MQVLGMDEFEQYGKFDLMPVAYFSQVSAARLALVSSLSTLTVERLSRGLGFGPLIARP
jgi:hypothetical protein